MQPEQMARLKEIFSAAAELPEGQQAAYIEQAAGGDRELHAELVQLLRAHARKTDLLPPPVPESLQVSQPPKTASGRNFGSYRTIRELGRGGMGTVYLAVRDDDSFRKLVALKVISQGVENEDFIRRFKQERQILAALDHPNIARILDGGATEDHRPFYVMEYVEGTSLDKHCDSRKCDVATRIRIFAQVCRAVDYLHNNSLIHRDLKPGNILVNEQGQAKLLDFGIAKIMGIGALMGTGQLGAGPTLMMTPGYASPEQIEGKEATRSSDIYSLGVILYQLLTGRSPFAGADNQVNLASQLAGIDPPAPSRNLIDIERRSSQTTNQFRRHLSGDLDRIVLMAIRRDPARRYMTAGQLADDLENYLNGRPVIAQSDSFSYRARKFTARNRIAMAVIAVLLLLTAGGVYYGSQVYLERVRTQAREAEVDRMIQMLNGKLGGWNTANTEQKVADVQVANKLLQESLPGLVTSKGGDIERSKQLLGRILGYLDRAGQLAASEPRVKQQIAQAYRQAGDLQGNPKVTNLQDRIGAIATYTKAADITQSLRAYDEAWVSGQLSELNQRVQLLGVKLDNIVPAQPVQAPVQEAPAEPPPTARPAAGNPTAPPPVATPPVAAPVVTAPKVETKAQAPSLSPQDREELKDLEQRLSFAATQATRARQNLEAIQAKQKAEGLVMNSTITTGMSRAEAFLEAARGDLQRSDLPAAKENMQRAEYELRRVFQSVGR